MKQNVVNGGVFVFRKETRANVWAYDFRNNAGIYIYDNDVITIVDKDAGFKEFECLTSWGRDERMLILHNGVVCEILKAQLDVNFEVVE